jgi:hypothetical protein
MSFLPRGEMCNVPTVRKHGFKPILTPNHKQDVAQTLKEHFAQTEPEAAPVPSQSDAVSEPDPIDDEFERALDQELDTIAEDASGNYACACDHA